MSTETMIDIQNTMVAGARAIAHIVLPVLFPFLVFFGLGALFSAAQPTPVAPNTQTICVEVEVEQVSGVVDAYYGMCLADGGVHEYP